MIRYTACLTLVLMMLGFVGRVAKSADDSPLGLRAGAVAQDVTPLEFPISVNGNMTDVQATGAHDPLHARCIVIANKVTSLAIVVVDSCALPRDLVDAAREKASQRTGIPSGNILISATHAHSCPTSTSAFQSDPNPKYVEFLIEQITEGIDRAYKQMEPARIGWTSVDEPSQLFNRRWLIKSGETFDDPFGRGTDRIKMNPGYANTKVEKSWGVIDPQVSILSVQARDGRPIALLANYSLHYVGGVAGAVVSADYFGEFASRIARELKTADSKPPFVGIMSNGTSGDVNNVNFSLEAGPKREAYEQMAIVAEVVTQSVRKVYDQIQYHEALPIRVQNAELELKVRKPTAAEVEEAEAKMAATPDRPFRTLPLVYARETTLLTKYPDAVTVRLQAIRIGSLGIVSSPCETFTDTGLAIKKESPLKSTFTIELANGYNGYLPPPEQHQLGGYETWRARSSYLAEDSEPKVRETLLRLLKAVAD